MVAARSTRVGSPAGQHRPRPPPRRRVTSRAPPAHTRLDRSCASSAGSTNAGSSRSTCTRSAHAPRLQGAEVGAADRGRAVARGHQQQLGRRQRGRVAAAHPGEQAREPGLRPQVEVVARTPGRRCPAPPARPPAAAPSPGRRPAASFAFEPGQCATADPARRQQVDVVVRQLHPVRRQHPPAEQRRRRRAARAPSRTRPAARRSSSAVSATWMCTSAPRARACSADRRERLGRQRVRRVRPVAQLDPLARPVAQAVASIRAETSSRIASHGPSRSQPGAAMIPGVSSTREPTAVTASITASVKKYISTLVVHPVRSSSTQPAVMPARTSSARSRPSAGHITSCSQRISGRSPPSPRSGSIGVWQWVLTSPGSSSPGQRAHRARRRAAPTRAADVGDPAVVVDVDDGVAQHRARRRRRAGRPAR